MSELLVFAIVAVISQELKYKTLIVPTVSERPLEIKN